MTIILPIELFILLPWWKRTKKIKASHKS